MEAKAVFRGNLLQLIGHLPGVDQIEAVVLLKARGTVADFADDGAVPVIVLQKGPPLRQGSALRGVLPAGEADKIPVLVLAGNHYIVFVRHVHAALLRQQNVPQAEEARGRRRDGQHRQKTYRRRQGQDPLGGIFSPFHTLKILPSDLRGGANLGEGVLIEFAVTHPSTPPSTALSASFGPGGAGSSPPWFPGPGPLQSPAPSIPRSRRGTAPCGISPKGP